MLVGVLKEIKTKENRVAMTPAGVEQMVAHGHKVFVETSAGEGSGFSDDQYEKAGASISGASEEIYDQCQMVMKVKEPLPVEYPLMRSGQILFTYFHFAAARDLTQAVIDSKSVAVAYETVEKEDHSLPLLTPMSEVAGRMAIQEGAKYLEKTYGGKGVLLGGVPGVEPGTVLVIGGGVVGTNAAMVACGLGAKVYLLDTNLQRLRYLSEVMPKNCFPIASSPASVRKFL
jgi:alanine dehydrogenase